MIIACIWKVLLNCMSNLLLSLTAGLCSFFSVIIKILIYIYVYNMYIYICICNVYIYSYITIEYYTWRVLLNCMSTFQMNKCRKIQTAPKTRNIYKVLNHFHFSYIFSFHYLPAGYGRSEVVTFLSLWMKGYFSLKDGYAIVMVHYLYV